MEEKEKEGNGEKPLIPGLQPGLPGIDPVRCLRHRHKLSGCNACVRACPARAIRVAEGGVAISDACTKCGACVGACPAAALDLATSPDDPILSAASGDTARFRCEKAKADTDDAVLLPCVSRLDATLILKLASDGVRKFVFTTGRCAGCPRRSPSRPVDAVIREAREAAAISGTALEFETEERASALDLGKRALFGRILGRIKDPQAGEGKPEELTALPPPFIPEKKTGLVRALNSLLSGKEPALSRSPLFTEPVISEEACSACSICADTCPTAALVAEDTETAYRITCEPAKCIGCGVCRDICFMHAVKLVESDPLSSVLKGKTKTLLERKKDSGDGSMEWTGEPGQIPDIPVYDT